MRTKLVDLLLVLSLCGFWGCASSKPVDTAAAGTVAAVDQNQEQMPARNSAAADKPVEPPSNTPKSKPNNNDAVARHETAAIEENPRVAAKIDTTGRKPADMKVANGFDRNPYLSSILKPLLPPRTTITDAAAGFKNQRQFIAAVHLSKNLGIPFGQIKTRMTGEHRMSLNDSLRDLHPEVTKNMAKAEVNKAERQAKDDESRAKDEAKKAATQEKLATNRKS